LGDATFHRKQKLQIVVFSGGRGSSVLSKELLRDSRINLTLAINGYDDGLSTGEIRRFLGDSLGPSDFRKNANRLASELTTCHKELLQVLEARIPAGSRRSQGCGLLQILRGAPSADASPFATEIRTLVSKLNRKFASELELVVKRFALELEKTER